MKMSLSFFSVFIPTLVIFIILLINLSVSKHYSDDFNEKRIVCFLNYLDNFFHKIFSNAF